MCDFLYGAVSKKDYNKKFISISLKHHIPIDCTFESCALFPVKKSHDDYIFFRLTNEYCDCATPLGYGRDEINTKYLSTPHKRQLYLNSIYKTIYNYIEWLKELNESSCINHVYIVKHFDDNKPEKQCNKHVVHIDDINIDFLIDLENEIAYKVQFYKKYD
ncbi:hypothetical protein [Terrisporobacter hibernicus]|uniref:Uncharacterized protein n=1 Tax=Terrisporobacter hibernicus TaxID=2813371 RepID=A0AAX2ZIZ9_9FIRM|nr:hypothetical protein [Terrisporobacter hibernicus]UEL48372.1 hypothetical protein JW646_02650 [Terrisporobacter hibernicus]